MTEIQWAKVTIHVRTASVRKTYLKTSISHFTSFPMEKRSTVSGLKCYRSRKWSSYESLLQAIESFLVGRPIGTHLQERTQSKKSTEQERSLSVLSQECQMGSAYYSSHPSYNFLIQASTEPETILLSPVIYLSGKNLHGKRIESIFPIENVYSPAVTGSY